MQVQKEVTQHLTAQFRPLTLERRLHRKLQKEMRQQKLEVQSQFTYLQQKTR